jgi:hypothetical protein
VIDVVLSLKDRFAKRDQLFRKIDQLVFGKTEIRIPEAYDYYALKTHTPLGMFAASTITSTLCSNDISIQFSPLRQGEVGDANATKREQWHESAFERQEEDAGRAIYYPWTWNVVTKGLGIQKTLKRSQTMWASYYRFSRQLYSDLQKNPKLTPEQRRRQYRQQTEDYKLYQPFPIVTTDVPPESFYYIRGEQGLTMAAECKYVPYNRLVADFGEKIQGINPRAFGLPLAQDGQILTVGDDTLIPCYELWDDTHVNYVIENVSGDKAEAYLLECMEHGLGDPQTGCLRGPYSISQGVPTSSRDPELESVGVLYAFLEVLPLLDAVVTARGQVAFYTGWPPLERVPRGGQLGGLNPEEIFGSVPTNEEQDDEPIFEPGHIMPVGVRFANPPRTGEDLIALQNSLEGFLSPLLPASAYGGGPAESGYAHNQRVHMNMLVWDPLIKNMQKALAHRFAIEDMLVEQIGEPVYVERWSQPGFDKSDRTRWLPLAPEDIQGASKYHVIIQPTTPSNDALLVKQLMDEKMAGWESDYGAIERLGKSYDEIMTQLDVERVMKSEPVQKQIDQEILQQLNLGQDEMLQEALSRLGQLGQAGYGGQPPQPGAPANGPQSLGLAMNNPSGAGQPGVPNTGRGQVFAPGVGMPQQPSMNQPVASVGSGPGQPPGTPMQPATPQGQYAIPGGGR